VTTEELDMEPISTPGKMARIGLSANSHVLNNKPYEDYREEVAYVQEWPKLHAILVYFLVLISDQ